MTPSMKEEAVAGVVIDDMNIIIYLVDSEFDKRWVDCVTKWIPAAGKLLGSPSSTATMSIPQFIGSIYPDPYICVECIIVLY